MLMGRERAGLLLAMAKRENKWHHVDWAHVETALSKPIRERRKPNGKKKRRRHVVKVEVKRRRRRTA